MVQSKTPILEYANIRKTGLQAITLRDGNELIEVKVTDNNRDIFLVTKRGQCIRFNEKMCVQQAVHQSVCEA